MSEFLAKHSPLTIPSDASAGRPLTVFERCSRAKPEDHPSKHWSQGALFQLFIIFTIMLNTLMLGIELDAGVGFAVRQRIGFFIVDVYFLLVFYIELVAKLQCEGWGYFETPWNLFDYAVVCTTTSELMVAAQGRPTGALKMILSVRILRVFWIVKTLKNLKGFYGLWLLVKGFLDGLRTQLWVAMLLLLVTYCGAVVLTTFVGGKDDDWEYWPNSKVYFGSVFNSAWTILQLGTYDKWCSDIVRPMSSIHLVGTTLLIILLALLSLGIFNVMLAVMVEQTLANDREKADTSKELMSTMDALILSKMAKDFREVDRACTGELDRDGFAELLQMEKVQYKFKLLGIQLDEAGDLFDIIDCDNSGTITADEYVLGLSKLHGLTRGQDIVALISFTHMQCGAAFRCLQRLKHLNKKADYITVRLNSIGKMMSSELYNRAFTSNRTEDMWRTTKDRHVILERLEEDQAFWYPPAA